MGRFRKWGLALARKTEHPVFVRMHETGVPVPVDPRVFFRWAEAQPKPDRYKLMAFFRNFIMSERYSKVIAGGANYHDLDGNVTRPVTTDSIQSALANLAEIDQMRAARLAAKPKEKAAA